MSKRSITIISLNYAPEDTAIGLYSSQMAAFLVQNGWEVQVIAGFPYYPQWEIAKEYQNKPSYYTEEIDGVTVFRYKQFVPKNPSFFKRSLQIIDFTFGNLLKLKRVKNSDVVLSIIPYTSSAWIGNRLAKRMKAKHWIHIQDFEFDAAFESGLTSKKGVMNSVATSLFKLEESILNKATLVSTISNGMLRQLESKTKVPNFFFPNWVDESFINPDDYSPHPYMKPDKFNVLYSGNIGSKQDWDLFSKVVKELKENTKVEFIIVGAGATKDKLLEELGEFPNVSFYNPVAYSELNNLLCSADLQILFQKTEVIDTVMPSKILGMMASRKPSIVSGNIKSEVCDAFKDSKGGVYIGDNSVQEILETIIAYSLDEKRGATDGHNARNYVIGRFTKTVVLESFLSKLKKII